MNKKLVKKIAFTLTVVLVIGFVVEERKMSALTIKVDHEITAQKQQKAQKDAQLKELQTEYNKMDSLEYVEKVAREQLGMVEKDTIVIKKK